MNCDLILTEDSCRFCLGDTTQGSATSFSPDTYFYVDRRLKRCGEIFELLDLKIHSQNSLPNVPNKVCQDCKKTITDFYSLKKNFQDNEAVLLGKTFEKVEDHPLREQVIAIVDEYLKNNLVDSISVVVDRYNDKLIIKRDNQ